MISLLGKLISMVFPDFPRFPRNINSGFPNDIFTTENLETSSINLAIYTLGLEMSNYNIITREDLSTMGLVNSYSEAKVWALNILIHYKFKKMKFSPFTNFSTKPNINEEFFDK